ncbi:8-oxo-dGTP pyrophosphatase MutT (NUDIX family) [Clostridium pascui]|uniref:NUDIX hydrolase n=1 Tax=Clostridium pascui TaxID=46609 RepID=UPI00195C3709|nr:NUDIX hydrolase [Clostridium pascui]MBM7871243.1 8-oxo-dGTP pyrophosphatase MutT (NUDIX family) [Clostridium pascui]
MNWIESIKKYTACNDQEKKDKEITIKGIEMFDDILTRDNELVHMTSSAFVVNKNRDKTLMVHHNIFNSWSWTGGHADGEEDLLFVAIKELKEEAGVKNICPVSEDIVSLDIIHVPGHIKKGKYVSPHLHISIAYLVEADENEPLVIKPDENSGVQWIPIEEIDTYSNEPHMKKIYNKIISKIQALYKP